MKNKSTRKHAVALYTLAILSTSFMTQSVFAEAQNYTLDPSHTSVVWEINHFGYSNPSGKWLIESGTLSLDEAKLQNSKVNATISVGNMITGIPKLDEHLKSDAFFDVAKYPSAHFTSTKVIPNGKNKAKIEGNLTLHGVTKPVTLNLVFNKAAVSPITKLQTAGFSATADIKRSDFGVSSYIPGLSDEVHLNIQAEAQLAPVAK